MSAEQPTEREQGWLDCVEWLRGEGQRLGARAAQYGRRKRIRDMAENRHASQVLVLAANKLCVEIERRDREKSVVDSALNEGVQQ